MNFVARFRKFLYTHIFKKRIPSVQLRGRVSDTGAAVLKQYQGSRILSVGAATKLCKKTDKKILLEIGFGNGSHVLSLAKQNKDHLVIGCEMYLDGVVRTLEKAIEQNAHNLYFVTEDARDLLAALPKDSLSECYVLFPDPWPKARHHKRRIVTSEFCDNLLRVTRTNGSLILATDWASYGVDIETIIQKLIADKKVVVGEITQESRERILGSTFAERAKKEGREVYVRRIIRV